MKCKILHESKGRLRVHLFCGKMSLDNADVLEYYLRAVNGVTDVSVYDRTCDAVIVFTDRKAVLKALAAFAFEKAQKMCLVRPGSAITAKILALPLSVSLPPSATFTVLYKMALSPFAISVTSPVTGR